MKFNKKSVAAVGSLLAAATVLGTPPAQADFEVYGSLNDKNAYAYSLELAQYYDYETPEQATSLAYTVCQARGNGWSEVSLRRMVEVKYSIELTVAAVTGAE